MTPTDSPAPTAQAGSSAKPPNSTAQNSMTAKRIEGSVRKNSSAPVSGWRGPPRPRGASLQAQITGPIAATESAAPRAKGAQPSTSTSCSSAGPSTKPRLSASP